MVYPPHLQELTRRRAEAGQDSAVPFFHCIETGDEPLFQFLLETCKLSQACLNAALQLARWRPSMTARLTAIGACVHELAFSAKSEYLGRYFEGKRALEVGLWNDDLRIWAAGNFDAENRFDESRELIPVEHDTFFTLKDKVMFHFEREQGAIISVTAGWFRGPLVLKKQEVVR